MESAAEWCKKRKEDSGFQIDEHFSEHFRSEMFGEMSVIISANISALREDAMRMAMRKGIVVCIGTGSMRIPMRSHIEYAYRAHRLSLSCLIPGFSAISSIISRRA